MYRVDYSRNADHETAVNVASKMLRPFTYFYVIGKPVTYNRDFLPGGHHMYTKYNWLHIPTGERGESPLCDDFGPDEGLSFEAALRVVNTWNSRPGDYRYWVTE